MFELARIRLVSGLGPGSDWARTVDTRLCPKHFVSGSFLVASERAGGGDILFSCTGPASCLQSLRLDNLSSIYKSSGPGHGKRDLLACACPAWLLMAEATSPSWLPDVPLCCDSFRVSIRRFLKAYATKVDVLPPKAFSCWVLDLPGPHGSERLYVYEEKATEATFTTCDQCRIIGTAQWSSSFLLLDLAPPCPLRLSMLHSHENGAPFS